MIPFHRIPSDVAAEIRAWTTRNKKAALEYHRHPFADSSRHNDNTPTDGPTCQNCGGQLHGKTQLRFCSRTCAATRTYYDNEDT